MWNTVQRCSVDLKGKSKSVTSDGKRLLLFSYVLYLGFKAFPNLDLNRHLSTLLFTSSSGSQLQKLLKLVPIY